MRKEQEIYRLLKSVNQELFSYMQEIYKPYGLTSVQFAILLELLEENHQSVTKLGNKLAMSKSNISAVLQRMEANGFIHRIKCDEDLRSVYVELSEQGSASILKIKKGNCIDATPFSNLTEDEQIQILRGLTLLHNIVKESEKYE